MLHISIITTFPELYTAFTSTSLLKKAQEKKLLSFSYVAFADCVAPKERIDTPAVGHGAGMVLRAEVVERALDKAVAAYGPGTTVFFSPQGQKMTQSGLEKMYQALNTKSTPSEQVSTESSHKAHLIVVCGRYEGIDCRAEKKFADYLVSLGDFVLMSADSAAQVFLEAFLRHHPGVVGKKESVEHDSFTGPFFDYLSYGAPDIWHEEQIPPLLKSGNHAKIASYREKEAAVRTVKQRFDYVRQATLDNHQQELVRSAIPPHYVVLMHDQVLVGKKEKVPGRTSVTTIDLHDIARSSTTYGIEKVFIVTPLKDQQRLLDVFLSFWRSSSGHAYNHDRYDAMNKIVVCDSLAAVQEHVRTAHDKEPLQLTTSARAVDGIATIDYQSQDKVWIDGRPILLVFGTGQGLTNELVQRSDFLLAPLYGFSSYNHLSVRAAVAIILDRWLGYHRKIG